MNLNNITRVNRYSNSNIFFCKTFVKYFYHQKLLELRSQVSTHFPPKLLMKSCSFITESETEIKIVYREYEGSTSWICTASYTADVDPQFKPTEYYSRANILGNYQKISEGKHLSWQKGVFDDIHILTLVLPIFGWKAEGFLSRHA